MWCAVFLAGGLVKLVGGYKTEVSVVLLTNKERKERSSNLS